MKTFGEGKDLDYTIELETLPEIKVKPLNTIKATEYNIEIEKNIIDKRISEIAKSQQNFEDKNENEKAEKEIWLFLIMRVKSKEKTLRETREKM